MEGGLYEADLYAWSEQQAAALRRLAVRRDVPNELDLPNIAEEIESLGRSELHAAESFLRLILTHVLLTWADPESDAIRHWAAEIVTWHIELKDRLTPAMLDRLDLNRSWRHAIREADAKLAEFDRVSARLRLELASIVEPCPVSLTLLTAESFDLPDAVACVAEASGAPA